MDNDFIKVCRFIPKSNIIKLKNKKEFDDLSSRFDIYFVGVAKINERSVDVFLNSYNNKYYIIQE